MKILVFDNYDSFTYNLVHLIEKVSDYEPDVFRNDKIALEDIEKYDKILVSPGPGIPSEAGNLLPMLKRYASQKSILGVCLGHQAIAETFGGSLRNLENVFHGISTPINVVKKDILFESIPDTFNVGRYHSWIVNNTDLPKELEVTAVDEHGNIMAMAHKTLDIKSVQFHPESVLTEYGEQLMSNWLKQ